MKPANPTENTEDKGRRRVPRRSFAAPVGVLLHGKYSIERSYQVGEGGMMISCSGRKLIEGDQVAVSFYLPSGVLVMVRGIVRAVVAEVTKSPQRYGLEFENLGFQYRREIRNFVAAATSDDNLSSPELN